MTTNLSESIQMFDYQVQGNSNPAILCTLKGYLTYHDVPNRNRRKYPNGFWQRQCDNERIKEMLDTRTMFGEAKHPGKNDSPMVELPNVSHSIREISIDDTGVHGTVDVLNTTQGRAVKTLIDYGSKIGISTRAFGKQNEDSDGNYIPDEDNYMLVTWDLVTFPAFSEARMQLTDSLDIEVDLDSVLTVSRDELVAKIAKLPEADAKALCDATGIEYFPPVNSEIQSLRKQLDEAADRIAAIEARDANSGSETSIDETGSDDSEAVEDNKPVSRIADHLAEMAATRRQIAQYLDGRELRIAEFDAVADVALKQKEELKALRSANVVLAKRSEDLQLRLDSLSKQRDEISVLAQQAVNDFEAQEDALRKELLDRDEEIQAARFQLDQTEAQMKDLMSGRKKRFEGLVDSTTEADTDTQPMFESLLEDTSTASSRQLSSLINKLAKR